MTRLKLNSTDGVREVEVSFMHLLPPTTEEMAEIEAAGLDTPRGLATCNRVTVCYLNDGSQEYEGVAVCAKGDTFNKSVGRKLALTRALAASGMSKEERRQVWDGYWGAINSAKATAQAEAYIRAVAAVTG